MTSARSAITAFERHGHRIRPGDPVIDSPDATHRDPSLDDDPLRFDPQRWLGQPRRSPNEFVPFGGGKQRCLGSGLVIAELMRNSGYAPGYRPDLARSRARVGRR